MDAIKTNPILNATLPNNRDYVVAKTPPLPQNPTPTDSGNGAKKEVSERLVEKEGSDVDSSDYYQSEEFTNKLCEHMRNAARRAIHERGQP